MEIDINILQIFVFYFDRTPGEQMEVCVTDESGGILGKYHVGFLHPLTTSIHQSCVTKPYELFADWF